jgi:hypothetical protein
MKHIKLYEDFLITEKAYQLTGSYGAKGIIGKVAFAFKKEVERTQYDGNVKSTLDDLNDVWSIWANKDGSKIIEAEVMKQVKNKESIVYIMATLNNYKWIADKVNGVNSPERAELLSRFPGDFVINVGFVDDVNANKYSKKLGGMANTALASSADTEVLGRFDASVGYNNVEIRGSLFLTIDAK